MCASFPKVLKSNYLKPSSSSFDTYLTALSLTSSKQPSISLQIAHRVLLIAQYFRLLPQYKLSFFLVCVNTNFIEKSLKNLQMILNLCN